MTDQNKQITIKNKSPKEITNFGVKAAKQLVDLVNQNKWAVNIQGNNYLRFEAWQTVGKFFNNTVKTLETNPIEVFGVKGFEAKSVVIDNNTGMEIGRGEASCMYDEKNWAGKPQYALKSMAQTRAGSKALKQVYSWVVVLAGYQATPLEEIGAEIEDDMKRNRPATVPAKPQQTAKITPNQIKLIYSVAQQLGYDDEAIHKRLAIVFKKESLNDLTSQEASQVIKSLLDKQATRGKTAPTPAVATPIEAEVVPDPTDIDAIDAGIKKMEEEKNNV